MVYGFVILFYWKSCCFASVTKVFDFLELFLKLRNFCVIYPESFIEFRTLWFLFQPNRSFHWLVMNFWSSLCLMKIYCTVWFVCSISISKWIYFILKFLQIKFNTFLFMWALEFLKSKFSRISYKFQSCWFLFLES